MAVPIGENELVLGELESADGQLLEGELATEDEGFATSEAEEEAIDGVNSGNSEQRQAMLPEEPIEAESDDGAADSARDTAPPEEQTAEPGAPSEADSDDGDAADSDGPEEPVVPPAGNPQPEPAAPPAAPTDTPPPAPDEPQVPEPPAPEPPPDPNLIANPGFELDVDGWIPSFGASLVRSTDRASEGLASAQVTNRTDTWQGAQFDLVNVVTPGGTYEAALSASVGTPDATQVLLTVQILCAGQEDQFVQVASGSASGQEWTRLSGSLQVPTAQACALEGFLLYAEGPPAGVDLFVDDAVVIP